MADRGHEIEIIARGLVASGGRVLLCKSVKGNYYYLPGGHVEFSETANFALAREFVEETGTTATVGDLLLTHEHLFRDGHKIRHEINLVFHVELDSDDVTSLEPKIAFEWVPLDDLGAVDIRPEGVREWLNHPTVRSTWRSEDRT